MVGRGFLDTGGDSEIGVDGWLLLIDSLILCVLCSVGVGGTAGGGMIAASAEDGIAGESAEEKALDDGFARDRLGDI